MRKKRHHKRNQLTLVEQLLVVLKSKHAESDPSCLQKDLRLLVLCEHKCMSPAPFRPMRKYLWQIRDCRLKVAERYQALGGQVSALIFHNTLPSYLEWPGVVGLIANKGLEHLIAVKK